MAPAELPVPEAPPRRIKRARAPPPLKYHFQTLDDAAGFASKAQIQLLRPRWLPPGFASKNLTVALNQLPADVAISMGRRQRVAITHRFSGQDGNGEISVIQSTPPPLFDFLDPRNAQNDSILMVQGRVAYYVEAPQGILP